MRFLKIFVVVFGIGLLLGFALLFLQVREQRAEKAALLPSPQELQNLQLPPGARIAQVVAADHGWALLADGPAGQEVILLDRNGLLKRRLRLAVTPGS